MEDHIIREEVKKCLELRNSINATLARLENQLKTINKNADNREELLIEDNSFSDHDILKPSVEISEISEYVEPSSLNEACDDNEDKESSDYMLPSGWRTVNMPGISASGSKKILIKSPNGRTFYNTLSAIQFLIKNGKSEEDPDVKLVSLNLEKEGWRKEPFLPKGWMMSGNKSLNNCKYLTDQLKYFGSTKAVIHFMKKNGHNDESIKSIETRNRNFVPKKIIFKKTQKTKTLKNTPCPKVPLHIIQQENDGCKPGVWEDGGDSLPPGWKKTNYGKGPGKGEHVMCPEGVKYKSRFVAFQQMLKMNFPPNELAVMKLKMREYEGWDLSKFLPEGWMYKVHWEGFTKNKKYSENIIYLSREGQSFHSLKQAIDFIMKSGGYSPQDADNCQIFLKERLKLTMESRFAWKESNSVPHGWKVRDGGDDNGYVMSPEGFQYKTRYVAIQAMASNNCPLPEILSMRSKLIEYENWNTSDLLPKGWIFRSYDTRTHFLSANGISFENMKEVINHMNSNPEMFNQEDLEKCKEFLKQRNQQKLGDRFEWESSDTLPTGWEIRYSEGKSSQPWIRSPRTGDQYRSRFCAIQEMMKNRNVYTEQEIESMRQSMINHESWIEDQRLPKRWLYKIIWEGTNRRQSKLQTNVTFLTSEGEQYSSCKTAIDHMRQHPDMYSSSDEISLRNLSKSLANNLIQCREDWIDNEETPHGWRLRYSDGTSSQQWVLSPKDGQQYRSRFCAIQDMFKKTTLYSDEEIESMRKSMIIYESWVEDERLPTKWLYKIIWEGMHKESCRQQMSVTFLTSEGEHYTSYKTAIDHMRNHAGYSPSDEQCLKKLSKSLSINLAKNRQDWIKDEETLPSGWKLRYSEGKSSQQWILSPKDGRQYRSRFSAIQDMIKNKDLYTEDEVEVMRQLMIEHESWVKDERLPSNWLYKVMWEGQHKSKQMQSNIFFLSSEGEYFGSFKTATEHMKKFNHYSEFNQENLRNLQIEMHNNLTLSREDWVEDDESLPNGWMKRFANKCEYFLRPDGRQFKSRLCGYQAMIRDEFPEDEITSMRAKLVHEGWLPDDLLPENWFYKKASVLYNNKVSMDYQVLSSNGDHFMSLKAASKFMSQNLFPSKQIKNFDRFIKNDRKNNVLEKNTWLEDDYLPEGWRYRPSQGAEDRVYYLSACGQQFLSALTAVQFMYEHEQDRAAIDLMRHKLVNEGWSFSPDIPSGWQQKAFKTTLQYLDRNGVLFKTAKHALTEIQSSPEYSHAEVELLRARVKSEEIGLDDKYTWRSPDNLPRGWKVRRKLSRSRKMIEFFLAPDGKMLRGKAAALAHMATLGASPGDVVTMRSFRWFRVKSKVEKQDEEVEQEEDVVMGEEEMKKDNMHFMAENSEIGKRKDDDGECTVSSTTEDEDDSMDTSTGGNEVGTIEEVKPEEDDKEMWLAKLGEIAALVQTSKKYDKMKLMDLQNCIQRFGN